MAAKDLKPLAATPAAAPTRTAELSPEQKQATARLDFLLVVMVLVLTFLLGSFAVKNSDFWMHLATGREIAALNYNPGVDPFSSTTTANDYWVNHSWLYDLATYLGYQALGGTGLVVLKALFCVAIAGVLLQLRRPNQSLWIPAICTALAMVAVSPRLTFQPVLVSLLFLALTLLILVKARDTRWVWLLVPLFVLWVNLDQWFFLGPITAGLFVLGEIINSAFTPIKASQGQTSASWKALLLVVVAGSAACLINPHHVYAFTTLPLEVSLETYADRLRSDAASPVAWMFFSPLQFQEYLLSPRNGLSVATWAFLPLSIAGLVSFGLNWRDLNWSRLLIFAAFAGLGLWRAQCLGFFAVVAGPVLTLNFQDFARKYAAQPPPKLEWVPALRGLGITLAVLAVFAVIAKTSLISLLIDMLVKATMGVEGVARTLGLPDPSIPFLVFAVVTVGILLFAVGPLLRYLSEVLVSWPLGGRVLSILLVLVLLIMVWPGWLHIGGFSTDPQVPRRVAWTVEPDPSMEQVSKTLASWRQQGLLPEGARGFHTLPQMANYFAWFNPAEKGFYDHRYALFAGSTETFLELRRLLNSDALVALMVVPPDSAQAEVVQKAEQSVADMEQVFRDRNVRYVVLTGLDTGGALAAVRNALILEAKRPGWKVLDMDGKSVIVGWNDPQSRVADSLQPAYYDAEKKAFAKQKLDPSIADRIPATAPPAFDVARYMNPPRPRLLETDEALMQLFYFQGVDRIGVRQQQLQKAWVAGTAAGLFGVVSGAAQPGTVGLPALGDRLAAAWLVSFRGSVADMYLRPPQRPTLGAQVMAEAGLSGFISQNVFDDLSPGPLLLGIRAARKSLANNPEDAISYFRLAKLYQTLATQTRERHWNLNGTLADQEALSGFGLRGGTTLSPMVMQELAALRRVQYVAALRQAEILAPEELDIYLALADHFNQVGFRDLSVKYREMALELVRKGGPATEADREAFDKRIEQIEKQVDAERRRKELVENEYAKQALRVQRPLDRAMVAREFGLAETSLDILKELGAGDVNTEVFQLQMEMLLQTGRLDEMVARFCGTDLRLKDELKDPKNNLGLAFFSPSQSVPAVAWYGWLLASALGDHVEADNYLKQMEEGLDPKPLAVQAVTNLAMERMNTNPIGHLYRMLVTSRNPLVQQIAAASAMIRLRLNLLTLRGLAAMEAGDTEQAREHFEKALELAVPKERYLPQMLQLAPATPLEQLNAILMADYMAAGPIAFFEGRAASLYYLQLLQKAAQ